jgi:hypothetical protein
MSPLSGPYERKDLPVAEKQKWTPVPPYIPRIQRERLCSASVQSPPPSSSAFKQLPRSQPAAANVALSPVAPAPAMKNAASEGSVLGPLLTQGQWRRPRPDSDSGGDKHVDAGGDKDVNVQPHVSRRGSILIAQALALKHSHYVLSWQLVFSGSLFPFIFLIYTVHVVEAPLSLLVSSHAFYQWAACCSSLSWFLRANFRSGGAAINYRQKIAWSSSCRQFESCCAPVFAHV